LQDHKDAKRVHRAIRFQSSKFAFVFLIITALSSISISSAIANSDIKITGLGTLEYLREEIDLAQSVETVAHQLHYLLEQEGYVLAAPRIMSNREVAVSFGKISKITVNGFSEKTGSKIEEYFQPVLAGPPKIQTLDRALALTNDIAGVAATVALAQTQIPGEYEAVVTGVESKQSGLIAVDSVSRKLFDDKRIQLQQNLSSVFLGGDQIRLQGSFVDNSDKPNSRSLYGSYLFPIGNQGTYAEVSAGDFETDVPITPFQSTLQSFKGQTASITLGYPFERSHGKAIYLIGSLDWSDDESGTIGRGDTHTTAFDLSIFSRHETSDGQSIAYGLTAGAGDNDSNDTRVAGNFRFLQGSFGLIQPVPELSRNTEVRFELFGQVGSKKTPDSQLIGLGSELSLRGYRNATYTGQTGVWGSVEIAHTVSVDGPWTRQVTPLAFVDFGSVRNSSLNVTASRPRTDELVSVGAGLRMNLGTRGQLAGFVGVPVLEDGSGETPDPRVYLRLSWGW